MQRNTLQYKQDTRTQEERDAETRAWVQDHQIVTSKRLAFDSPDDPKKPHNSGGYADRGTGKGWLAKYLPIFIGAVLGVILGHYMFQWLFG